MKVAIHHNNKYGWVLYDPLNKDVMVTHSDEAVRNTVRDYLSKKKLVDVPADNDINKIGNRVRIEIHPKENSQYLEMALTEMFHATGVHVDWGREGHSRGSRDEEFDNLYSQEDRSANKTIVKSLLDGDFYDIIN